MAEKIPDLAYARAIFETAESQKCLDAVYADFRDLIRLLRDSAEFAAFIRVRSNDLERVKVVESLFKGKGHELTLKAIHFLAVKNRLEILPSVADKLIGLYQESRGIVPVEVISYGPLDQEIVTEIERKWSQRLGKTVETDIKVDPSILGGVIFRIKDHLHDYSIKEQLNRLREQIIKV